MSLPNDKYDQQRSICIADTLLCQTLKGLEGFGQLDTHSPAQQNLTASQELTRSLSKGVVVRMADINVDDVKKLKVQVHHANPTRHAILRGLHPARTSSRASVRLRRSCATRWRRAAWTPAA